MPAKFDRRHFIAAGTSAPRDALRRARRLGARRWPSRQIRMICSYPAGGQTDLLARAYGEFISKQVGKTVVVENKPGASGAIGTAEVARAEPDGHTILCSISTTYIMNRVVMKNPGYDMDKDLTLASVIPGAGLLLVANPKTGVKTLEDFVAFARKSGKVNFGTYSAGSAPHMTIHELNNSTGFHRAGPLPRRSPDVDGDAGRHARCRHGQLHGSAVGPAERPWHGIRGAFEEGRRDPGHKDPPRAGRDVEILHRSGFSGRVLMAGIASTFFECTANTVPRSLCRTDCAAV